MHSASVLSSGILSFFLASFTSAHFELVYPPVRGFNEDTLGNYPCGGQDEPSAVRTDFNLDPSGNPIQLDLGHTSTMLEVLLAVGNNPSGADFVTILRPTFQEIGPQDFCIGAVTVPEGVEGVRPGANGTILVQSNGDPSGGLYNCADVTFVSAPLTEMAYNMHCTNSSGVQAQANPSLATTNANGTAVFGAESESGSGGGDGDAASSNRVAMAFVVAAVLGGCLLPAL